MKISVYDYRRGIEMATEHAHRLLHIIRTLDSYVTPDGISDAELETLFKSLDAVVDFIKYLNGGEI